MALHSPSRSIWFFTILLGVWHLAPSASIHAFNTDTHAPLSELAASHYQCRMEEFVIGQLGEQKGLRTRAIVLDDVYKLPVPGSRYATNYLGALIMGAIDEDSEQGAGRDFLDSVPDTISRARMGNHFYCPTRIEKGFRDKAFNDVFEGVLRGYSWWTGKHLPAVDSLHWAWDNRGASPTPRGYENFSWQHARRQYYFWLTEMNPSERDWRAGETFYALGHVIHLVQDLAQPQHTRNDGHSQPQWYGQLSVGDDSQFEKYCSAKYGNIDEVKGLLRKLPTSQIPIFKHLPTTNSDGIPPELRAFWDTGQLNGNEEDKRQNPFNKLYEDDLGLAEFSNSFFVTSDTMFTGHYAEFTYPDVSGRKFLVHNFLWDYDYDAHFFPYPRVTDLYGLGALWPPHNQPTDFLFRRIPENILVDSVTVGVNRLSPDISDFCSAATSTHPSGQLLMLTLTDRNREAHAKVLLPKAIAYSAGLLNYFFRGRLKMEFLYSDEGTPSPSPQIRITNLTEKESLKEGFFTLLREDPVTTNRTVVAVFTTQNGYPGKLASGESFTNALPLNAQRDGKLILVFQGTIGNEKDIAIAAVVSPGLCESIELLANGGSRASVDFGDEITFTRRLIKSDGTSRDLPLTPDSWPFAHGIPNSGPFMRLPSTPNLKAMRRGTYKLQPIGGGCVTVEIKTDGVTYWNTSDITDTDVFLKIRRTIDFSVSGKAHTVLRVIENDVAPTNPWGNALNETVWGNRNYFGTGWWNGYTFRLVIQPGDKLVLNNVGQLPPGSLLPLPADAAFQFYGGISADWGGSVTGDSLILREDTPVTIPLIVPPAPGNEEAPPPPSLP